MRYCKCLKRLENEEKVRNQSAVNRSYTRYVLGIEITVSFISVFSERVNCTCCHNISNKIEQKLKGQGKNELESSYICLNWLIWWKFQLKNWLKLSGFFWGFSESVQALFSVILGGFGRWKWNPCTLTFVILNKLRCF